MTLRALAAAFAVLAPAAGVRAAEPRDPVAAEALFADGQRLMETSDYQAACPKLEESYRLDPATGALFALAICHEKEGKIASAWVEFMDAASRASAEGYAEREHDARQHAEALKGRLSYLALVVDPQTAALDNVIVSRNGIPLGPAAWESAIPVDPGPQVVHAIAPGYAPWTVKITVGSEPERHTVNVPRLLAVAAPQSPTQVQERVTPLRIAGLSVGAAGLAGLGFATYSALRAVHKNDAAESDCDASGCGVQGDRDRAAATEAANLATVGAIAGSALLATGVVLFVLGAPDHGTRVSLGPSSVFVRTTF
ncbi:MAG TPA: hypothetical protein VMS65_04965 [Polyangiaceae bacterium]|nr:hypothetical protein [Polyangiaceae bacterium]